MHSQSNDTLQLTTTSERAAHSYKLGIAGMQAFFRRIEAAAEQVSTLFVAMPVGCPGAGFATFAVDESEYCWARYERLRRCVTDYVHAIGVSGCYQHAVRHSLTVAV